MRFMKKFLVVPGLLILLSVLCLMQSAEAREPSGYRRPYPPRRYSPQGGGRRDFSRRPPLSPSGGEAVTSPNMTKKRFSGKNGSLPYCQFAENMHRPGPTSLLLVLHGRSGSGSDNTSQLVSPALRSLIPYLKKSADKVVVLAPQCPSGGDWTGGRGGRSLLPVLDELVREKCREFGIPKEKCFITGVSMGGSASYTFMAEYPGVFARALVVCAACREPDVPRLRGEFYIVHGENDRLIPAERAERTAQLLSRNGGCKVSFSCMPGKDHISCAESAYTADRWKLLFR